MISNLTSNSNWYRNSILVRAGPGKDIKRIRNWKSLYSIKSVSIHDQVGVRYQDWHIFSELEHSAGCLTQWVTQYPLFVAPILKPRNHQSHLSLLLVYTGTVIQNVPDALWFEVRIAGFLGMGNPCSDQ